MKHNVALIGAGNIGLLYDCSRSDKSALSHAKGIYWHKGFRLKYVVEKNKASINKIKTLFPDVQCFSDWRQITQKGDIDVLVVALPTGLHFKCLKDFEANKNIKIFFIEKPLFNSADEYGRIKGNIMHKILINYTRRFEPSFMSLKHDIEKGAYGKPVKVMIKYTKGFKHNGSHAVDLLNYFFNAPGIRKTIVLDKIIDYRKDDPTLDVFVKVQYKRSSFPVYFIGLNENNYSVFEMDLLFEKKRIELADSGMILKIYDVIPDAQYPGYQILAHKPRIIQTGMPWSMLNAYKVLDKIIVKKMKNISGFDNERYNSRFIDLIRKEARHV